ncbi:MAG: cysteine-rich CWC family protein [Ginsengibacter sp.]
MCEHEKKYCPRCRARFECKVGSILLCQCTSVTLTESESNYLHEKYEDCLCASCMKELKVEFHNNHFKQKLKKLFGIFSP